MCLAKGMVFIQLGPAFQGSDGALPSGASTSHQTVAFSLTFSPLQTPTRFWGPWKEELEVEIAVSYLVVVPSAQASPAPCLSGVWTWEVLKLGVGSGRGLHPQDCPVPWNSMSPQVYPVSLCHEAK